MLASLAGDKLPSTMFNASWRTAEFTDNLLNELPISVVRKLLLGDTRPCRLSEDDSRDDGLDEDEQEDDEERSNGRS